MYHENCLKIAAKVSWNLRSKVELLNQLSISMTKLGCHTVAQYKPLVIL